MYESFLSQGLETLARCLHSAPSARRWWWRSSPVTHERTNHAHTDRQTDQEMPAAARRGVGGVQGRLTHDDRLPTQRSVD